MAKSRSLAVSAVGFTAALTLCGALLVGEQPGAGRVTFATFNAALIPEAAGGRHGANGIEERRREIGAALRDLGADVTCLQEVWRDRDYAALRDGLRETYPHSYRPPADPGPAPGLVCPLLRGWRLLGCVRRCRAGGASIRACVDPGGSCAAPFSALDARCRLCLAANIDNPIACAIGGARSFVYGGSTGLVLLSRHPLKDAHFRPFRSTFIRRGVISAGVAGRRVLCTHLTSGLGVLSYPADGPHGDWEGEHRAQVDALLPLAGGCTVLLGDLNAGPATRGLVAERAQTIARLRRHGFTATWARPRCTWCRDNPLATGSPDRWLDHVLVKDCPAAERRYERVLDRSSGAVAGRTLSDHYGLLMVEDR